MPVFAEFFDRLQWQAAHVSDFVPWRMLAAPGVILQKEAYALQRTYQVRGQDLQSETREAQAAKMLQANNVLKRLGGRWMLQSEAQRGRLTTYPAGEDDYPVATLIDEDRRRTMLEEPGARETQYYVTLTWQPPTRSMQQMQRLFVTGLPELPQQEDAHEANLLSFVQQADYFMDLLRSVLATCFPLPTNPMLTYLHSTVSDDWHPVVCPGSVLDIDTQLCDTPYTGGHYPQLGRWHLRTCSLIGYPAQSFVGIVRQLDTLDLDYRWCTRWLGMEKVAQKALLKGMQHAWVHQEKSVFATMAEQVSGKATRVLDSDATRKAEEIDMARQELGADIVAYGDFTSTVTVWDTDPHAADLKLEDVMQTFRSQGFTVTAETVHAERAWQSSHPGNRRASVRRRPQHSLTVAHLLPGLVAAWPGPERDEHLRQRPWFLAHTDTSGVFRVVNHVRDLGHFLMLGATRSGKSTLANFLRAQWMLYRNAQAKVFDLDGHARLLTYLLGGSWHDLGSASLRFQPLRHVDDPVRRGIALQWLLDLCSEFGIGLNAGVHGFLSAGLGALALLKIQDRTFSRLLEFMAHHTREIGMKAKAGRIDAQGISHPDMDLKALEVLQISIRQVLHQFAEGGEYGGIFDGTEDVLGAHPVQTFELRSLLQRPRLVGPVLGYVFPELERQMSTEAPMFLLLDDAAVTWLVPRQESGGQVDMRKRLENRCRDWLMTSAKKSVSLGFATHSLSQVFGSALGPLLEEGCPTRFFLPMTAALEPNIAEIYAHLGLTPQAIHTIATARPQADVYYSCRELGHRLCHLRFSPFVLDCIAHNDAADHALMDDLLQAEGREGFAAAWFRHHGYLEAATRLERRSHATTDQCPVTV